jgi:hypothetical protein
MKSFYKITSRGFELMEKLDITLDNLAELDVSSEEVEELLPRNYYHLYLLWKEWHDIEFCDIDVYKVFEGVVKLHDLEQHDLIIETYKDND